METVTINDFAKLDIRIAEITAAEEHPNADKLILLKLKVGEEEKQIVAGIKKFYSFDELVGKKITIINNLEPVELRGERSEGMLLAASDDDGLTLVTPEKDISCGARVK